MLTAQSSRMMKDSVKRACKPKDKRFRDVSVKCTVYINKAPPERHLTEKRRDMPAKVDTESTRTKTKEDEWRQRCLAAPLPRNSLHQKAANN